MAKRHPYTQMTMKALRDMGYIVGKVERWNPYAGAKSEKTGKPTGIREDLFGFIDLIAIKPPFPAVGVQCTSATNHSNHRVKILESDIAPDWLACTQTIQLWSWRKSPKKRGGKQMIWKSRVEVITKRHFEEYCND